MSKHMIVSLVKSAVRALACGAGIAAFRHANLLAEHAFILLFVAEVIGVIEELFEK